MKPNINIIGSLLFVISCTSEQGRTDNTGTSTTNIPEVNVVGVYEAEELVVNQKWSTGNRHGTVKVQVTKKGLPIILALCAYEPILWEIDVEKDVQIDKIIISGYYKQEIHGYSGKATIQRLSYEENSETYFQTYGSADNDYAKAMQIIKMLTKSDNLVFQGQYSASKFVIK